jgi:hypothetical protein
VVLSKRERAIATAAVIALAVLLLDRFVLTPVRERRSAMAVETEALLNDFERTSTLFERRRRLWPKWREMLDSGLASDLAEAESRVLHALRDWSQQAGLTLSSLRPERVSPQGELREITFQASGTGRLSAVTEFLRLLEYSSLPVRATELQIGSRREGADELSLQLRISALCLPVERTAAIGGSSTVDSQEDNGND